MICVQSYAAAPEPEADSESVSVIRAWVSLTRSWPLQTAGIGGVRSNLVLGPPRRVLAWSGRPRGTPLRGDGAVRQESDSLQRFLISLLFPSMRGTSGQSPEGESRFAG